MNIILIGYRATGKTTVARLLSEQLGWPWVDLDVEIERLAGKSIAQIFAEDGEPAFRDLESQVVADFCARQGWIIAAGGGAPLRMENRQAMRRGWQGVLAYGHAGDHLSTDDDRPHDGGAPSKPHGSRRAGGDCRTPRQA